MIRWSNCGVKSWPVLVSHASFGRVVLDGDPTREKRQVRLV